MNSCPICSKRFSSVSELEVHVNSCLSEQDSQSQSMDAELAAALQNEELELLDEEGEEGSKSRRRDKKKEDAKKKQQKQQQQGPVSPIVMQPPRGALPPPGYPGAVGGSNRPIMVQPQHFQPGMQQRGPQLVMTRPGGPLMGPVPGGAPGMPPNTSLIQIGVTPNGQPMFAVPTPQQQQRLAAAGLGGTIVPVPAAAAPGGVLYASSPYGATAPIMTQHGAYPVGFSPIATLGNGATAPMMTQVPIFPPGPPAPLASVQLHKPGTSFHAEPNRPIVVALPQQQQQAPIVVPAPMPKQPAVIQPQIVKPPVPELVPTQASNTLQFEAMSRRLTQLDSVKSDLVDLKFHLAEAKSGINTQNLDEVVHDVQAKLERYAGILSAPKPIPALSAVSSSVPHGVAKISTPPPQPAAPAHWAGSVSPRSSSSSGGGFFSSILGRESAASASSATPELDMIDRNWVSQMKRNPDDQEELSLAHLRLVFQIPRHPLGIAHMQFLNSWFEPFQRIQDPSHETIMAAASMIKDHIPAMFDKVVNHYSSLYKHYGSKSKSYERLHYSTYDVVYQIVWMDSYTNFYELLKRRYWAEDQVHNAKINEFLTLSLAHLGLPQKFWLLPQSDDILNLGGQQQQQQQQQGPPYHRAIQMLKTMVTRTDPNAKLRCLLETMTLIDKSVQEFYQHTLLASNPDAITVGADELLPIFAFVVIKANVPNVYSEASFMELFIEDQQAVQREGYALATMQSALMAICSLSQLSIGESVEALFAKAKAKQGSRLGGSGVRPSQNPAPSSVNAQPQAPVAVAPSSPKVVIGQPIHRPPLSDFQPQPPPSSAFSIQSNNVVEAPVPMRASSSTSVHRPVTATPPTVHADGSFELAEFAPKSTYPTLSDDEQGHETEESGEENDDEY